MELMLGIALKARKDKLAGQVLRDWYDRKLRPSFAGRIVLLDETVAERAALLQAEQTRPGNDTLIAATALVHDLVLVRATSGILPVSPISAVRSMVTAAMIDCE